MGAKCIHFSRAICGLESSLRPVYDASPFHCQPSQRDHSCLEFSPLE